MKKSFLFNLRSIFLALLVFVGGPIAMGQAFSFESDETAPLGSSSLPSGFGLSLSESDCPTCGAGFELSLGEIPQSTPSKPAVESTGAALAGLVNRLPSGSTKRGLTEYIEALGYDKYGGDSVGMQNDGLQFYFSSRFQDPQNSCVRSAANAFYADVAKTLKEKTKQDECRPRNSTPISSSSSFHSVGPDYGCVNPSARAKVDSRVGAGDFKDLSPGWVWDLAMKHSKGDPNSAMFLIGMCGHDDTYQGFYTFEDKTDKALDEIRDERQKTLRAKSEIDKRVEELSKSPDLHSSEIFTLKGESAKHHNRAQELATQSSLNRTMSCPPDYSGFYAPQSLGGGADIPDELKSEVQRIQGTVDGAKNIPAKYYHIYGSAFMACQLVQNGVSPGRASFLQQQAARFYRGIRMCGMTNQLLNQAEDGAKRREYLMKEYKVMDSYTLAIKGIREIQKKKSINVHSKKEIEFSSFLIDLGYSPAMLASGEVQVSDTEIRDKVEAANRNEDAARLYSSWYVGGGTVMNRNIPCSDLRVWGPSDLMNPNAGFFSNLSRPKEWSNARYQRASQKLATWDVDFKWTIAQHKAGAEFAGSACKKRAPDEKPLKGICPAGPPDGTTVWDEYGVRTESKPSPSTHSRGVR